MLESKNHARCSINHLAFDLITYVLRCFIKVLDQKFVSHERRLFFFDLIRSTILLYWFQDAFHIKCSIRELFCTNDVFFIRFERTYRQLSCYSIFFSSCQCRRDISEVASFCLTWIARDLQQWTNSNIESRRHCLTMNEFRHRESSSLLTLLQILEYVSVQSSHESDSRIRALSILLYSSTITSDAQSRAETKSLEHEVFLYWRSLEERNLQKERDHSNTKSFSQLFFDLKLIRTRITCFSFIDLKLIRTRVTCFSFIVLKLIRTRIICFNWKSFVEHNLSLLSSASLLDHIEMTWFEESL